MTGLDFGGVAAISLFSWGGGHMSGAKNQFHVTSFAPHAFGFLSSRGQLPAD